MKRRWIAVVVTFWLAALPKAAFACSVCFDPREKNRAAFVITTMLLTFFPLGMVGGAGVWLRKRFQKAHEDEEREAGPAAE